MDGMSTQDILNGQDLSTANVDDLLAAMKAEEAVATVAEAPSEEAPKPKRGRKKAAEPIEDIPDLEAMLAGDGSAAAEPAADISAAEPAASSPAEIAEADAVAAAMAAMESMPEEPVAAEEPALGDLLANEADAQIPVSDTDMMAMMAALGGGEASAMEGMPAEEAPNLEAEATEEAPAEEPAPAGEAPVQDVDAMMAAMAAAETASDVDAMMAAMAAGTASAADAMAATEQAAAAPAEEAQTIDGATEEPVILDDAPVLEDAPAAEEVQVTEELPVTEEMPVTEEVPVAEEIPVTEGAPVFEDSAQPAQAEAEADIDPVMAAMMADMAAAEQAASAEPASEEAVAGEPALEQAIVGAVSDESTMAAEEAVSDEGAMAAEEAPSEETPAENLDAILNAEVDALVEPEAAEETHAAPELDPVAAAMLAAEAEALQEEPSPESEAEVSPEEPTADTIADEPQIDMSEIDQTSAVMDMEAASDAMEGAVEDIEEFLSSEDYEYLTVKDGSRTLILMKTSDENTMALVYEGNEFDSLESCYCRDGNNAYKYIMNALVKETIRTGGNSSITRHKGSKVVAK